MGLWWLKENVHVSPEATRFSSPCLSLLGQVAIGHHSVLQPRDTPQEHQRIPTPFALYHCRTRQVPDWPFQRVVHSLSPPPPAFLLLCSTANSSSSTPTGLHPCSLPTSIVGSGREREVLVGRTSKLLSDFVNFHGSPLFFLCISTGLPERVTSLSKRWRTRVEFSSARCENNRYHEPAMRASSVSSSPRSKDD